MTVVLSSEQQAIVEGAAAMPALAIAARAGTGKTFTLMQLAQRLGAGSKLYAAFNKDIVAEVEPRLRGTDMIAKTFHALGLAAYKARTGKKRPDIRANKHQDMVRDLIEGRDLLVEGIIQRIADLSASPDVKDAEKFIKQQKSAAARFVDELVRYMRLKLVEWDDTVAMSGLIERYGIDEDIADEALVEALVALVPAVMQRSEALAEAGTIDFTGMIYWPVRWGVRMDQYQYVFVDECQDLSPMQRALIKRSLSPTGRIVLVGDPKQAIYAFAGADGDSFALSVEEFGAQVLPLTVTRRCALAVVHHSRQLVPDFRGLEGSPRGEVAWMKEDELLKWAKPGDMVLSRIKAPLIKACMQFISADVPATVLGNEIGKALSRMIDRITNMKAYSGFDAFPDALRQYREKETMRAQRYNDQAQAERIADECDALQAVYDRIVITESKPDAEAMKKYIEGLFSDKRGRGQVILATGHKSKGLEADRVFILAPDKLPLQWPDMDPEQQAQEQNIDYVIRTRAKRSLVYCVNDKFEDANPMPPYANWIGEEPPVYALDWGQNDAMSAPALPVALPAPSTDPAPVEAAVKQELSQRSMFDNTAPVMDVEPDDEAPDVIYVDAVVPDDEPEFPPLDYDNMMPPPEDDVEADDVVAIGHLPSPTAPEEPAAPETAVITAPEITSIQNRGDKRQRVAALLDGMTDAEIDTLLTLLSAVKASRTALEVAS